MMGCCGAPQPASETALDGGRSTASPTMAGGGESEETLQRVSRINLSEPAVQETGATTPREIDVEVRPTVVARNSYIMLNKVSILTNPH